jgi:hypothetical protein
MHGKFRVEGCAHHGLEHWKDWEHLGEGYDASSRDNQCSGRPNPYGVESVYDDMFAHSQKIPLAEVDLFCDKKQQDRVW